MQAEESTVTIRPDRVGRIGASQVGAILDLNPFASPAEVQQDILTGAWDPTPRVPGLPARMGHIFESGMLVALEDWLIHEDGLGAPEAQVFPWEPCCLKCGRVGSKYEVGQTCGSACDGIVSDSIVGKGLEWAMATPDGRVEFQGALALAECKAPFRGKVGTGMFQWGEPGSYRAPMITHTMSKREVMIERLRQWPIPIYYGAQTQWQMGVARTQGAPFQFNFLVALGIPNKPLSVYTIEFDEALFDMMLAEATRWRERHLIDREPAAIRSKEEALALFPAEKPGKKKILTPAEHELFCEWQRRKIMASVLTHAKNGPGSVGELEWQALQIIGDADEICDPEGKYIGRFPAQATGGRIDAGALKKALPDVHRQFYRPGGSTRVWRPQKDWKQAIAQELADAGIVESDD